MEVLNDLLGYKDRKIYQNTDWFSFTLDSVLLSDFVKIKNNDKNIIWRYKYLKIGGEKKEERKVLEEYFSHKDISKKELYETGLYLKTENNNIMFDKEERKALEKFIKDDKIDHKNIKKNQILKND